MTRPDDSSLSPSEYAAVQKAARAVLDKTSAWGRFPTPISEVMDAAKLRVAPVSAFDPRAMERYLREAGHTAFKFLKKAIDKVLGVFDVHADTVHIDDTVHKHKQNFLKLHETGHKEIPHQRGLFKWIQDCAKTLSPEVADLFDREANHFASLVLFQDDTFAEMTADSPFGIETPLAWARNLAPLLTPQHGNTFVAARKPAPSQSWNRRKRVPSTDLLLRSGGLSTRPIS